MNSTETVLKGKLSAKISGLQLFCLLFLSRIFLALSRTGASEGTTLSATIVSLLIDTLLAFLILIPFFYCMRRRQSGLLELAFERNKTFGRIVAFLLFIPCLYFAAETVFQFGFYYREYIMENTGALVIAFLMALAVAYAAFIGLEGIARMSFLVFVVAVVTFFLIGLGASGNYEPIYLRALGFPVNSGVFSQALDTFSYFFDLIALMVVYGNTVGKRARGFVFANVLGTAVVAGLSVMVTTALGDGLFPHVSFPVHTLAGISELSIFQRLDAGYLIVWTLLSFVRSALYGFCAYKCLYYVCGAKRAQLPFYLFSGLFVALCSLFSLVEKTADFSAGMLSGGIMMLVLVAGIPLCLILFGRRRVK